MALEVYQYTKCGTCRKAIKFLDDLGIEYNAREITETPPSEPELRAMLNHYNGDIRKLFNTSGQLYRKLKMKDRLDTTDNRGSPRPPVAKRDVGQAALSADAGCRPRRIQGRRLAPRFGVKRNRGGASSVGNGYGFFKGDNGRAR